MTVPEGKSHTDGATLLERIHADRLTEEGRVTEFRNEEITMNQKQGSLPVQEYRSGTTKAAIWRNDVQKGDRTVVQYSVKFERSYYDKQSQQWKQTDYFFPDDLPDLELVTRKAFEFVRLSQSQPEADMASAGT